MHQLAKHLLHYCSRGGGEEDRHTHTVCLRKLTEHPLLLPEGHISHMLEGYLKEDTRDTALVSWILNSLANRDMPSFGTLLKAEAHTKTHTKDHCWSTYDQGSGSLPTLHCCSSTIHYTHKLYNHITSHKNP